jgi:hypothetical protein
MRKLGGDNMRKVIALVMAIAVVTAFVLPTATASSDSGYAHCIKILNTDKIPFKAKAAMDDKFWEPLSDNGFKWYLINNLGELQNFCDGMALTYAQMMEWGVWGSWEPEDGLDFEKSLADGYWSEFGAWNAWENSDNTDVNSWAHQWGDNMEIGAWNAWETEQSDPNSPYNTDPALFLEAWNEWGSWASWEFNNEAGEPPF